MKRIITGTVAAMAAVALWSSPVNAGYPPEDSTPTTPLDDSGAGLPGSGADSNSMMQVGGLVLAGGAALAAVAAVRRKRQPA